MPVADVGTDELEIHLAEDIQILALNHDQADFPTILNIVVIRLPCAHFYPLNRCVGPWHSLLSLLQIRVFFVIFRVKGYWICFYVLVLLFALFVLSLILKSDACNYHYSPCFVIDENALVEFVIENIPNLLARRVLLNFLL